MKQFSTELINKTEEYFLQRAASAGEIGRALKSRLEEENFSAEMRFLLKWMYANSPLADWGNYDFSLFCAHAEHGLFLREHSPYSKDLPEKIFLSYVLHPRVNDEELCDSRFFFFSRVHDRILGLNIEDAVREINYFCAENVSYASADDRTRSALSAFRSATGRCGEESVFAVNVFRAVGIPARQVYAPRWSHCDDNHAWVEVLCGDKWRFLGACEPEEVLDKGWFNAAASRAMFAYARCFGAPSEEEVLFCEEPIYYINVLKRYAPTKTFSVFIKDGRGAVEGADVYFEILNYSSFDPVCVLKTDNSGAISLACGLGNVHIRVRKGECVKEVLVDTADDSAEIFLDGTQEAFEIWDDFIFTAPKGSEKGPKLSEEQRAVSVKRCARARLLRENKCVFDSLTLFRNDKNFAKAEKDGVIATLSQKDLQDIAPEVLKEACSLARGFEKKAGELFFPYVVCPRVLNEPLFPCREQLFKTFSEKERAEFAADPEKLYREVFDGLNGGEAREFTHFYVSPIAALKLKRADELSKKVLFVTLCRTLGIPARISPIDSSVQYFRGGKFVSAGEKSARGVLVLEKEEGETWRCGVDYSLCRVVDGKYRRIQLDSLVWTNNLLEAELPAGEYRIITQNRLPSGNIRAKSYRFVLPEDGRKQIKLLKNEGNFLDMTIEIPLDEISLRGANGNSPFTFNGEPVGLGGAAVNVARLAQCARQVQKLFGERRFSRVDMR